jgi:uncharacterized membrane-anchored protein
MKTPFIKLALATFVVAAASATVMPVAQAQDAVASKTSQQVAIEKAAAQGPTAVRRYIHRTRMIYALTWADFYPAE